MKKFILPVLALVLTLLLILYHSSYTIALTRASAGTTGGGQVVDIGVNNNGEEYKVVFSYDSTEDRIRAYHLTRDRFGIWHVIDKVVSPGPNDEDGYGYRPMGWMRYSGFRRYGNMTTRQDAEFHALYVGDNAKKYIQLPADRFPPNTTATVFQQDNLYVIHLIHFADGTDYNNEWGKQEFMNILKNQGYIS